MVGEDEAEDAEGDASDGEDSADDETDEEAFAFGFCCRVRLSGRLRGC